jgi:hypothetical protein
MQRLPCLLLATKLPGAAAPLDSITGVHSTDVTQARVWGLPVVGEVTQSFRVDGTPDGVHFREPVAKSP